MVKHRRGMIYDSGFMSQMAATAVVKVRIRDMKIVPYHVWGRSRDRLKMATSADTEASPTGKSACSDGANKIRSTGHRNNCCGQEPDLF